jgi:hypothetical protein
MRRRLPKKRGRTRVFVENIQSVGWRRCIEIRGWWIPTHPRLGGSNPSTSYYSISKTRSARCHDLHWQTVMPEGLSRRLFFARLNARPRQVGRIETAATACIWTWLLVNVCIICSLQELVKKKEWRWQACQREMTEARCPGGGHRHLSRA